MRILLTGALGYLGSHVWPHLVAAGHEVVGISRANGALRAGAIEIRQADLLEPGVPAQIIHAVRPDMILHLAWTVEHGKFWTDPTNLDWLAASVRLARAAEELGVRRFVGIGTCFEYDWPARGDCHEQTTPLKAHTLYDTSKSALRAVLEAWTRQNEMSFAWGRVFHLYGGEEHPEKLVADIARHVIGGQPAECSSGLAVRDFMDVRDAGAAIAALALSSISGPVNIATGSAAAIAEIAKSIGDIAGRPDLIRIGARPDRPNDPPRIVADVSRLRDSVGFRPQYTLRQGLSDALVHWRDRMHP